MPPKVFYQVSEYDKDGKELFKNRTMNFREMLAKYNISLRTFYNIIEGKASCDKGNSKNLRGVEIIDKEGNILKKSDYKGYVKAEKETPKPVKSFGSKIRVLNEIPKIPFPANVLILGKRYAGKTTLIKSLIDPKQFSEILFITNNNRENSLSDIVPEENVYTNMTEGAIEKIIEIQEEEPEPVLIILDDYIGMRDFNPLYSNAFKKICSTGRHNGISLLVSSQELASVNPILRKNTESAFFGKMNEKALIQVAEEFANANLPKKSLQAELERITRENKKDFVYYNDHNNKFSYLPGSVFSDYINI